MKNDTATKKLIIVTGGAGFIGSNVIKLLNDRGEFNIIVVDELGSSEKWKNLVGKRFIHLLEKDQLFDWLSGRHSEIRAFIHLGACSDTTEMDAAYLLKNNYQYSKELAEYAIKHGHRFIYASSAATYGDGSCGFMDDHDQLQDLQPLNMYGYSKHLFDLWLKNEGLLDQVVGLKYFNVYGPNECHKGRMASVVQKFVPIAQAEGVIKLFKSSEPDKYMDGGQLRDFIYVKDAARMTVDFLDNEASGIYNIGRGIPTQWNELANAIFNSLNKPSRIEYFPMPKDLIKAYQNYTCADINKVKEVLKACANCQKLEDSVDDYVQNYLIPGKKW
ncbi:MAG: ADP-glyceromanno-heptose 6-epimerase [Chlamydiota bacterium]|nr:ADP-glyceromanno-heptose 6-epimerase [Chlamydiota bacterium]